MSLATALLASGCAEPPATGTTPTATSPPTASGDPLERAYRRAVQTEPAPP